MFPAAYLTPVVSLIAGILILVDAQTLELHCGDLLYCHRDFRFGASLTTRYSYNFM